MKNFAFKYKDVYAAAAEVIGMALKYLSENGEKVFITFVLLQDICLFKEFLLVFSRNPLKH